MVCNAEFIEFLCSQIELRSRKLCGDNVIYLNEEPVITACNGICYVKKTFLHTIFNGEC